MLESHRQADMEEVERHDIRVEGQCDKDLYRRVLDGKTIAYCHPESEGCEVRVRAEGHDPGITISYCQIRLDYGSQKSWHWPLIYTASTPQRLRRHIQEIVLQI